MPLSRSRFRRAGFEARWRSLTDAAWPDIAPSLPKWRLIWMGLRHGILDRCIQGSIGRGRLRPLAPGPGRADRAIAKVLATSPVSATTGARCSNSFRKCGRVAGMTYGAKFCAAAAPMRSPAKTCGELTSDYSGRRQTRRIGRGRPSPRQAVLAYPHTGIVRRAQGYSPRRTLMIRYRTRFRRHSCRTGGFGKPVPRADRKGIFPTNSRAAEICCRAEGALGSPSYASSRQLCVIVGGIWTAPAAAGALA